MVAATKTVVGNVNNLSSVGLGVTTMLFDMDPAWVVIDNDIIVGVQSGGVKGEPVTPDPTTGAFSVALVAVDNPTWTITVTIQGASVETPIVIPIKPPPAAGTGTVDFQDLIEPASAGTDPVVGLSIRGASDYDNSVAPTTAQTIVWNGTKYHPGTVSAGSGLPAGGTVGQYVRNTGSGTGDWHTIVPGDITGLLTQANADGLYAPLTSGAPMLIWNGTAYPAKPTGVTHAIFQGATAHDPGGSSVDGDIWLQTA